MPRFKNRTEFAIGSTFRTLFVDPSTRNSLNQDTNHGVASRQALRGIILDKPKERVAG